VRHILHAPSHATTFRPERGVMPGIDMTETRFTTNAIGLRGREMPPPGAPRWIAVGGSSTESLFVDDADAWTAVLERELRDKHGRDVWLGNAGKSGPHDVQPRERAPRVRGRDRAVARDHAVRLQRHESVHLGRPAGRARHRAAIRHADYPATYGRFVFHEIRPPRTSGRWRLEDLVEPRGRALLAWPRRASPSARSSCRTTRRATITCCASGGRRPRRSTTAPAIDDCLRAYAANLRRIAEWAEARKVRLVLLTQGSLYRDDIAPRRRAAAVFGSVDESFFNEPPPKRYFSVRVMREHPRPLQRGDARAVRRAQALVLRRRHVRPQTSAMYYDDAHVNVRGSRTLGAELAQAARGRHRAQRGY
jgi:hypothetical protein